MNIRCVFEYDKDTDSYATYCPELPGLASCGKTEEDALNNFKEATSLYFKRDEIVPQGAKVMEIAL